VREKHNVKVRLKPYPDPDNKIWIDGLEIRNVTSFGLEAGMGKVGTVIIAFIANVDGEFEGAVNLMEDQTSELPAAREVKHDQQ